MALYNPNWATKALQPPALLNQVLNQNTWYTIGQNSPIPVTVLPGIKVGAIVVSSAASAETIELRLTLDGQVIIATVAILANENRWVYLYSSSTEILAAFGDHNAIIPFGQYISNVTEFRSFLAELRKTTNVGATAFTASVVYWK